MRPHVLAVASTLCLVGCLNAGTFVPSPSSGYPPGACDHDWPIVIDESVREAKDDGTHLVLAINTYGAEVPLSDVYFEMTWGAAREDAATRAGALSAIQNLTSVWILHHAGGENLTRADTLEADMPGDSTTAHWHLILRSADGRFLGGVPACG
jgi:hypothetical protein